MKKLLCCLVILILGFTCSSVNASTTFYDTRGTKYEGVVERMARLGIINGMTNTTYAPYKSVTRAELAKIIVKMNNMDDYADTSVEYKKVFSDVKKSDWFYPYVITAADLELINGYEDGKFRPNQEVTYAEMMVIMLRNLGYRDISQDNPEGWYKNYLEVMRELELNDYVGEVNFDKPAKRGDVALFAWNALITDKWAIVLENEKDGFTYSYSDQTPLEFFFDEYSFLDKATIEYIGALKNQVAIYANGKYLYTVEKIPLHALGGKISGLYNRKQKELIGVTLDEDYEDVEIVSGPEFYLKKQGYKISNARRKVSYGNVKNASYVHLIIENDKTIRRAVYVDSSNSIIIDTISLKEREEDKELILTINDIEYFAKNTVLYKNGFKVDWKDAKKGDVVTNLGNGLFVLSNKKITDILDNYNLKEKYIILNDDKYKVADSCEYHIYNEKDKYLFSSISTNRMNMQVGKKVIISLNASEEVVIIEFGQTDEDKEKYKVGFVTRVSENLEEDIQSIEVSYGYKNSEVLKLKSTKTSWIKIGDFIMIDEKENKYEILTKDASFKNNISVKYEYDAKEIFYPMIGEYIVNDETQFYKVTLKYENNSVEKIENCKVEKMKIDDISDLEAYKINLVYDDEMKVIRVFAVNEVNKFENQIALIKAARLSETDDGKEFYKLTLSIINSPVKKYETTDNYIKVESGEIMTVTLKENSEKIIMIDQVFMKESIGYKRDLIVSDFNIKTKEVMFENGETMKLNEDIYKWNNSKINLNNYRFVFSEVYKDEGEWNFKSLEMFNKEDLKLEKNDRFAIGELEGVIIIYRGYEG